MTELMLAVPENRRSAWERIFGLSIAVLNRLRYGRKFLLLGVLILAPLGYILYLQFSQVSDDIEFNQKEAIGVEWIGAARNVLHGVQKHRVLSVAVMAGEKSFEKTREDAAIEVDRAAVVLDDVDAKLGAPDSPNGTYGGLLQTTKGWAEAKAKWADIKGKGSRYASAGDCELAHAELVKSLTSLIADNAGNYSNLILDPDLDSYYLMDLFLGKLVWASDHVAKSTSVSLRSAGIEVDTDRTVELAGLYTLTLLRADEVETNVEVSIAETKKPKFGQSPTLLASLKEPMIKNKGALVGHAKLILSEQVVKPAAPIGRTEFVNRAIQTLQENHSFWEKVGPELTWLINRRIEKDQSKRTQGLVAGGLATVVLLYLFIGFYLSVRSSVASLGAATFRMIAGTEERFAIPSRDELAEIATSYNSINMALVEARRLRTQVESDNEELQSDIMKLLRVVSMASDGDLTIRAQISAGALGNVSDAFNQLLESLQTLMKSVSEQLERTNGTVAIIAESSRKMADGATKQASEVLTATNLVEQLNKEIARVSDNARVAAGAAKRTEESAVEGAQAVQDVISGMGALRSNVQAGAKKMKNLGDRSMEVTGIVATISRISDQTNMLALNAAIEAARAGEHGRGFSVVAEQVRKLAERTAVATQEIDKLVKAIQLETNETVGAIEQQTHVVEEESALVGRAGDSLARIRQVSSESAVLVTDITKIAEAYAAGTGQVVRTMGDISSIAKATQEGARGTAASIEQLTAQSARLTKSVAQFKVA
jgi:methyl-accepting chemotaxis protein